MLACALIIAFSEPNFKTIWILLDYVAAFAKA